MRPPRGLWDAKEVLKSSLFKKENQNNLCFKSPKIRHLNFFTLRVFLQIWRRVQGGRCWYTRLGLHLEPARGGRRPLGSSRIPEPSSRVRCVQSG